MNKEKIKSIKTKFYIVSSKVYILGEKIICHEISIRKYRKYLK